MMMAWDERRLGGLLHAPSFRPSTSGNGRTSAKAALATVAIKTTSLPSLTTPLDRRALTRA